MLSGRLADLGWTDGREAAFASYRAQGLLPGRVALEHNHVYRVLTADGEWLAETAGRVKYQATGRHELPAVGDWVALRVADNASRALIRAVLPRSGAFSRKAAGRETEEQVVAANIDTVFIVFGLDQPVKPRAIERYLLLARRSRAVAVVALNKADLSTDVDTDVAEAERVAGGAPVVAVSTIDRRGLADLEQRLGRGMTVALLGPSGAGKSSIVNRLIGAEVLPTGDVREWDARGRHTSVHRQLVVREAGGVVIDTPGMRELQLWDADEGLASTFEDIAELASQCRFRDCRHDRDPGCAVKAAVDAGTLDAGRYEGYLKLDREREAIERKQDERLQIDAKRQGKIAQKAYRSYQKARGRKT